MEKQELHEDMKRVYNQFMDMFKKAAEVEPGYAKAFMGFANEATKAGEISKKDKELIVISLSVIQHCKYCIAFHVKAAFELGATPGEIMEAALVAGIQGGGPAVAQLKYVMDAIRDFSNVSSDVDKDEG